MLGLFFLIRKSRVVAKLAQAFHCRSEFKEKEKGEVNHPDETLFFFL